MTEPDKAPSKFSVIMAVAAMTAAQAIGSMTALWLPAIAPKVAGEVGIHASMIGYQVVIIYISAMVTSLFVGGLVNRWGAWRTCQVCLLFMVASLLCIASGSIPLMVLGSILIGLGYGLVNPPASHILSRVVTGKNRNLIFSIRYTGVPLGGIAASIFAPRLALDLDWQTSFWIAALVPAITVLLMQPARDTWDWDRKPRTRVFNNPLGGLKFNWSFPPLRWLSICGLCFAGIQISLMSYTVTLLVEEIGFTLIAAGLVLSAVQIGGVIGRVSWGVIADKVGNGLGTLMVVGGIIFICSALAFSLNRDWSIEGIYLLFFIFGFTGMGWNGVAAGEIARIAPKDKITYATAAVLFITYAGVLAGPMVFATAFRLSGSYTATFAVAAILALVGVIVLLLAKRSETPR